MHEDRNAVELIEFNYLLIEDVVAVMRDVIPVCSGYQDFALSIKDVQGADAFHFVYTITKDFNVIDCMNQEEKREDQRSLIKYALPVTVNTMGKRGKDKKDGKDIATTDVEDILNSILPPREYTKDKQQLYIESVLSTPATETDVIMLQHVTLLFK